MPTHSQKNDYALSVTVGGTRHELVVNDAHVEECARTVRNGGDDRGGRIAIVERVVADVPARGV